MSKSQKFSFLWYLGREIIKQTKKLSLITYPFSFGTVPFGSARLMEQYGTERFCPSTGPVYWNRAEPFLQRTQKSTDSGSIWNGSKGYSVNARPIRTNFGTVLFGTILFGSSVNGAIVLNN